MSIQVLQTGGTDRCAGLSTSSSGGNLFPAHAPEKSQPEEDTDKWLFYGVDVVFGDVCGLGFQSVAVQLGTICPRLH